jgi:hypothetical protein
MSDGSNPSPFSESSSENHFLVSGAILATLGIIITLLNLGRLYLDHKAKQRRYDRKRRKAIAELQAQALAALQSGQYQLNNAKIVIQNPTNNPSGPSQPILLFESPQAQQQAITEQMNQSSPESKLKNYITSIQAVHHRLLVFNCVCFTGIQICKCLGYSNNVFVVASAFQNAVIVMGTLALILYVYALLFTFDVANLMSYQHKVKALFIAVAVILWVVTILFFALALHFDRSVYVIYGRLFALALIIGVTILNCVFFYRAYLIRRNIMQSNQTYRESTRQKSMPPQASNDRYLQHSLQPQFPITTTSAADDTRHDYKVTGHHPAHLTPNNLYRAPSNAFTTHSHQSAVFTDNYSGLSMFSVAESREQADAETLQQLSLAQKALERATTTSNRVSYYLRHSAGLILCGILISGCLIYSLISYTSHLRFINERMFNTPASERNYFVNLMFDLVTIACILFLSRRAISVLCHCCSTKAAIRRTAFDRMNRQHKFGLNDRRISPVQPMADNITERNSPQPIPGPSMDFLLKERGEAHHQATSSDNPHLQLERIQAQLQQQLHMMYTHNLPNLNITDANKTTENDADCPAELGAGLRPPTMINGVIINRLSYPNLDAESQLLVNQKYRTGINKTATGQAAAEGFCNLRSDPMSDLCLPPAQASTPPNLSVIMAEPSHLPMNYPGQLNPSE